MKRTLWSRVMALFVGLWFVAVSAGPELAHACPMHGGHSTTASGGDAHSAHAALATDVAGSQHQTASSPQSASPHGMQCTCLGQCCGAAPVAVISTTLALAELDTVATRDAGLPDYAYVPVAAQHVLPLANAPPLSA
jgi:hypothetical protein